MAGFLIAAVCSLFGFIFSPVFLAVVCAVSVGVYLFLVQRYGYWRKRGVPGPAPKFPWGSKKGCVFITPVFEIDQWLYSSQGGKRYCGFFELASPSLFVGDPDLIRSIMIKDFSHFTDRRDMALSKEFVRMVSQMHGEEWKSTRSVMTPTFSASKLRAMHPLCQQNADNLVAFMRQQASSAEELDMKDCFGRFSVDNIASCALGVNCNSFTDPDTMFARHANFLFRGPESWWEIIRSLGLVLLPNWMVFHLPDPFRPASQFFRGVVRAAIERRDRGDMAPRHDFLNLLLETKDANGHQLLSDESVLCQAILFLVAGYDTTANLLTFASYCLARNPDCQWRARAEVDEVLSRHGGQLTYDAVSELSYLGQVLDETLRLYPSLSRHERLCTRRYMLPGTDVVVEPGVLVVMPLLALHRDADIYPQPMQFRPERFTVEATAARRPCTYLPFGAGPRQCLARRFALYEARVALSAVLSSFTLTPGPSTPPEPLQLDPRALLLTPADGILLKVRPNN